MSKHLKIGTVKRGKFGNYIQFDKDIEIHKEGKKLELAKNNCVNLQNPRQMLEFWLKNGNITEDQFEKRMEVLEKNDWLRFEVIVPPTKAKEE